jgi:sulfoxide reductase heme-binding subunit YedZ
VAAQAGQQSRLWTFAPPWSIYLIGCMPATYLIYAAVTNQLGADPVEVLENEFGEWALWLLIAGLVITPLRRVVGINLIKYRRALGVLAFIYVTLHFSVYLFLDRQLDWSAIFTDIWKRPYITVGVASFLLLLPLAITSNNWSIRRIGAEAWRRLHMVVYLAAPLAALHYLLLVKSWPLEPFVYLGIILVLVAFRFVFRSTRKRERRRSASA